MALRSARLQRVPAALEQRAIHGRKMPSELVAHGCRLGLLLEIRELGAGGD